MEPSLEISEGPPETPPQNEPWILFLIVVSVSLCVCIYVHVFTCRMCMPLYVCTLIVFLSHTPTGHLICLFVCLFVCLFLRQGLLLTQSSLIQLRLLGQ